MVCYRCDMEFCNNINTYVCRENSFKWSPIVCVYMAACVCVSVSVSVITQGRETGEVSRSKMGREGGWGHWLDGAI